MSLPECDMCHGKMFQVDDLTLDDYIPASQYYGSGVSVGTLVYKLRQLKATCQECGAEYLFTREERNDNHSDQCNRARDDHKHT